MAVFQYTFRRFEIKFLITEEQYEALMTRLEGKMVDDRYAHSLINNIYYDTPDFLLIRRSLEKPVYKEKLRLRAYGVPKEDGSFFIEIKKKYQGVVYKRRILAPLSQSVDFLSGKAPCPDPLDPSGDGGPEPQQIRKELTYFRDFYPGLAPAMFISYERYSLASPTDSILRITFDRNITWRTTDLDLSHGVYGERLPLEGMVLMEVKIPEAMPLWLSHIFDELKISHVSFSKYGRAYLKALEDKTIDPAHAYLK